MINRNQTDFRIRSSIAAVAAALVLASCATPQQGPSVQAGPLSGDLQAKIDRAAEQTDAGRALREGVLALQSGDPTKASKAFGRAVKLDPDNPRLHLLLALSYHVGYSRGNRAYRDLAETGYLVALRMDPNSVVASEMLGQLYLDSGRYADARRFLANGLLLGQSSPGLYHAFAVASYYERDVAMALWAITEAERLDAKSSPILRAGAMIRAAAGQFDAAEESRRRYDAVETDPLLRGSLARRVAQWRTTLGELASETPTPDARSAPTLLAQASQPAAAAAPVPDGTPVSPLWSDCAGSAPPPSPFGPPGSTNNTADETVQLPPLPSPCAGRPLPRMAVIDVTIIRAQDTSRTTKGINLLESLSVTLSGNLLDYQRSIVQASGANRRDSLTRNRTVTVALGDSTGGTAAAINYALNIANATDQSNEVIARPSLMVLDRQPSTFFAGSILSTVPPAGGFGGSARVDHPTGVSLSVTPTFIDDDSMLLAVKSGRSFFQDPSNLDLSGTVVTTRNMATANVRIRFNETLVLSGLTEREVQENETGVPLLKDVPLLQYLFKNETTLNYSHSIMVLLTPRLASATDPGGRPTTAERAAPEVQELRAKAAKSWNPTPNLAVTMAQLETRAPEQVGLYRAFRSGDLESQVWHHPQGVQRILSEIASFLYY